MNSLKILYLSYFLYIKYIHWLSNILENFLLLLFLSFFQANILLFSGSQTYVIILYSFSFNFVFGARRIYEC
jgi:hypothetical protein